MSSYKTKIDAYINGKKELSNTNGLHFVSKRIYLKEKLGYPVFLLLESE